MKRKRFLSIVIIIIIFLVIAIGTCGLILIKNTRNPSQKLEHSNSEIEAKGPNLISSEDDETFEIVGYGELEINKQNQNINLINSSENNVYLSFDVLYNDEILYTTGLISPGQMEQYNVYKKLDAGQYTLIYSIDVYDMNENVLWSGIQQEQKILIKN